MIYIDNIIFQNFRYILYIIINIFVMCRFIFMIYGLIIELWGMFSIVLVKYKIVLGKYKIFKNNFFQLKIVIFMIYYLNILKYIYVSSIDLMLFFLNWVF